MAAGNLEMAKGGLGHCISAGSGVVPSPSSHATVKVQAAPVGTLGFGLTPIWSLLLLEGGLPPR